MEILRDILIAVFLLMAAYGFYLMITGKDPDSRLAKEIRRLKRKNKGKAPVIYLRSFDAEKLHVSDVKAAFTGKVIPGSMAYWKDVGNIVTGYLSVIGPVLAIERPYQTWIWRPAAPERPETVTVKDGQWKAQILEWLEEAALVVIQLDATEGLLWEIGQVKRLVVPAKVLLILPPTNDQYHTLREATLQLFERPLPKKLPESRLLTFAGDWQAVTLQAHTGSIAAIWQTLEPVFEQNGFEKPDWNYIYDTGKSTQDTRQDSK
jgi:hypothetical protein